MIKGLHEFALFIILAITVTRFMFICVWKSMRDINDNLLSRFILNLAVFLSLFFTLTVPRLTTPGRRQVFVLSSKVFLNLN
jgi:hypothetical protein